MFMSGRVICNILALEEERQPDVHNLEVQLPRDLRRLATPEKWSC